MPLSTRSDCLRSASKSLWGVSHLPGSEESPQDDVALRAVLFDMDGTLVASDGVWDQAMTEMAAAHGGELPPDFFVRSVGLAVSEALLLAHELLGLSDEHLDRNLSWVLDRARMLLDEAPPLWFDGARELVRAVRTAGLHTGLVTSSGRTHVEAALVETDRSWFDVIVSGDDVVAPKPSPEPYLRAADALGVEPGECAVVEDSAIGVASALAAGCRVVVVAPVTTACLTVGGIAAVDLDLLRSLQHGRPSAVQG
ncbi:HAD family hydrolase [Cryptosporangium aurantiacum]|uniref:Haloacid dehalogenase superfamily, subfamily IA, variant 3 with third motif having DD or ED n=1 Tax=Cryptosporangium aurantiacum TaxID=134849 RepID=A0A1M7IS39_9ACTN|nr:HAD family phosphatase [Cryptosporangium aurantiacum]SHM43612.1 haloacid dehalogenase superfamily, subfamily IA, variant 3 with third motif having DD or ED [Cryptosporangium aurantiacum]